MSANICCMPAFRESVNKTPLHRALTVHRWVWLQVEVFDDVRVGSQRFLDLAEDREGEH